MKDWRGTEIEVGDTILYPATEESYVTVNEAVVSSIEEREAAWSNPGETVSILHADWVRSNGGNWKPETVSFYVTEAVTVIAKARQAVE
jgi:ketopantoate hydroxymethyltransferase